MARVKIKETARRENIWCAGKACLCHAGGAQSDKRGIASLYRLGHRAEIDLQSACKRCGQRQGIADGGFVKVKLMRDRRRHGQGPDRGCGVPALVVVTSTQSLP